MTKQQLQERNKELVRQCNKETDRADMLKGMLKEVYELIDVEEWMKIDVHRRHAIQCAVE